MHYIRQRFRDDVHAPIVVDVPHAGRTYPADFKHTCSRDSLHRTEDRLADLFYAPIIDEARCSMVADFPRTYVDVNKPSAPLDAGAFRRLCLDGSLIREDPLSDHECQSRILRCHEPYYAGLSRNLHDCVGAFGVALHFNLHTFPSTRIERSSRRREPIPHQIYIGDRHGATAPLSLGQKLCQAFNEAGFTVAHNDLFAGGHIIRFAAALCPGRVHAVQIEVRRDCYLHDDLTLDRKRLDWSQPRFASAFREAISAFLSETTLAAQGHPQEQHQT